MGQFKTICATSHLGQSMCSFCQGLINNDKFHKEITGLIAVVRDADFTPEAIAKWKAESSAKIIALTSGGQVASKAEFQWDLYGAQLSMQLQPRIQVEMTYGLTLREQCLGYIGGCPLLPCEEWMWAGRPDFETETEAF